MSDVKIDETGFGNLKVVQGDNFKYGIDAVLLSAFAAGETGARGIQSHDFHIKEGVPTKINVADLGTGNGIIPFILNHKLRNDSIELKITGIEKNISSFEKAIKGLEINELHGKIKFLNLDIIDLQEKLAYHERFDAVISNPPYFKRDAAIPNANKSRFEARHETSADINDFAICASSLLRHGGDFYLIHRPSRLADIFTALREADIEPKELQMIAPHAGESANLVLIHSIKGAKAELKLLPEINVYEKHRGQYSDLIKTIYERI